MDTENSELFHYMQWQNDILDDLFKLMPSVDRSFLSTLCRDTAAAMINIKRSIPIIFSIHPYSHFNFLNIFNETPAFPEIAERWREWEKEYPKLQAQYPMLDLHDHIAAMSQAYFCREWAYGYEICIMEWVQQNDYDTMSHFIRPPKSGFIVGLLPENFTKEWECCMGFWTDGWSKSNLMT